MSASAYLQLKTFIRKLTIRGEIDDTYNAKVADEKEVSNIIRDENNRVTNIVITVQVMVVFLVSVLLITALLLCRYTKILPKKQFVTKRTSEGPKTIQKQSITISFSIISFIVLLYILVLDAVALYHRENPPYQEINLIHHDGELGDPFSVLYNLPVIVMAFDVGVVIFSFTMLVLACFMHYKFKKDVITYYSQRWLLFLALSTAGPIVGLLTHVPFVAIAYLNDAFHAGSIFVYYALSSFTGFVLLQVAIQTWLTSIWQSKRAKDEMKLKEANITLSEGTLKLQQGSVIQVTGGTLTLNCEKVHLIRNGLVTSDSIQVKRGKLFLRKKDANFEPHEELVIEEGCFRVQQCDLNDEEAAIDIHYGAKLSLTNGGRLVIATYNSAERSIVIQEGELMVKDLHRKCFTRCLNTVPGATTCFSFITLMVILLFLSMMAILACYFVLIPINMSISNAANRLVGIYQSIFVVVGATVAYKTLFGQSSGIQVAVKERRSPLTGGDQENSRWRSLSDQEKVDEFYGIVVDVIAQHYEARQSTTMQSQQTNSTSKGSVHSESE